MQGGRSTSSTSITKTSGGVNGITSFSCQGGVEGRIVPAVSGISRSEIRVFAKSG